MSETIYSQVAGRSDIVLDQASDFNEVYQLCTNDAGTTFFDLSGYTPTAEIRNVKNGSLIATFTCSVVSAAEGKIQVRLTRAQTAALDFSGMYYWDCLISIGTTTYRVIEGSAQLSKSVTVPA